MGVVVGTSSESISLEDRYGSNDCLAVELKQDPDCGCVEPQVSDRGSLFFYPYHGHYIATCTNKQTQ